MTNVQFLGGLELLRDWSRWFVATGRGTEATASAYRRAIVIFFCDVLPNDLGSVDENTCFAYLLTLTANRRNDIARALLSFFGWADDRGYLPQGNPMRDYVVRRIRPGRVKYLTPEHLRNFFAAAREHPDLRAVPTFALMLGTGARIGSVVGARCEDVDLTAGEESLFWRVAKGGRTYSSVLVAGHSLDGALRLIELAREGYTRSNSQPRDRDLLVGVHQSESIRAWMRDTAREAGIPEDLAHPHAIRRTFGTQLARNPDMDLAGWVSAMGHSDGNSFVRYAAADSDRIRKAVARIGPAEPVTPADSRDPLPVGTPRQAHA